MLYVKKHVDWNYQKKFQQNHKKKKKKNAFVLKSMKMKR
jgi:hypothetical protein